MPFPPLTLSLRTSFSAGHVHRVRNSLPRRRLHRSPSARETAAATSVFMREKPFPNIPIPIRRRNSLALSCRNWTHGWRFCARTLSKKSWHSIPKRNPRQRRLSWTMRTGFTSTAIFSMKNSLRRKSADAVRSRRKSLRCLREGSRNFPPISRKTREKQKSIISSPPYFLRSTTCFHHYRGTRNRENHGRGGASRTGTGTQPGA